MKVSLRTFLIGMFSNYVLWFGRSIFALLYDDANHDMLVGYGKNQGKQGSVGLPQTNFLETRPQERRKTLFFKTEYCLF